MNKVDLLVTLSVALTAALVLGFAAHRLGLSSIVGYLLAGMLLGPFTPGPTIDPQVAQQLAELGVVLLMFGVGLHFQWKDLRSVGRVAIPGASVEILAATGLGTLAALACGWTFGAGLVLGLSISVASTVVLMRVLLENDALHSPGGHTAMGWLIVEDLFTVGALVLLPVIALPADAESPQSGMLLPVLLALGKLLLLGAGMAYAGMRAIPWLLEQVARTRSRELFTLTVLVLALGLATSAASLFGLSLVLGAFLAGMAVGQSDVSHQAGSDALPMRDAFAVLFFVATGMLFDPTVLREQPGLVVAILAIVLIGKPLIALLAVSLLGQPVRTALTVALAVTQIGEFSFILSARAQGLGLIPKNGGSAVVCAALVSISLNPLLFKTLPWVEAWLQHRPRLWRALTWRLRRGSGLNEAPAIPAQGRVQAVVVGYGPVGKTLTGILREFEINPVIIELNLKTVKAALESGVKALYGDASRRDILEAAGVPSASYLVVTIPEVAARIAVVAAARLLNPNLKILTRARYIGERLLLEEAGANAAAYEEAEIAAALATTLLGEIGAPQQEIENKVAQVRAELKV